MHPNEPLTVVQGPLAMAQILETPLLNHLNYQTLIATKAARIAAVGRGRPVLKVSELPQKTPTPAHKHLWRLDAGVQRLINPHIYHVSLTQRLWDLRLKLIDSALHQMR